MIVTEDVIENIQDGTYDDDLTDIADAISYRRKVLKSRKASKALKTLEVGDTVKFASNISPKYLRGIKSIIEFKENGKFRVRVVENERGLARKFGYGLVTVEPTLVEEV